MNHLFSLFLLFLVSLTGEINCNENQIPILKRLVYKIDLKSFYPNLTVGFDYEIQLAKVKASPNFKGKFSFVRENDNIYFLSTVLRPSILKLNIYLNSTLNSNSTETIKKIQKRFEILDDSIKRTNIFEFKVRNTISDILKAEKQILDQFENKIWTSKNCKNCLDIVHIKPDNHSYVIGIGSSEKHNELLDELCFLESIPRDLFGKLRLRFDYTDTECYTIKLISLQRPEEYTINAIINVNKTQIPIVTRMLDNSIINRPFFNIIDYNQ